jgi:hypothetical protein
MNEAVFSKPALRADFKVRQVAAPFRHSILAALGLELERRLRVVPVDEVWDSHISSCLKNCMVYAVDYMQIIGVGACVWEGLNMRDVTCTIPKPLRYIQGLHQSVEPLQKNIASELVIHLNDANSQQSTEMLIKAGYLRILTPTFQPLPSHSYFALFEVRCFLAKNRPWLHLKDDWYAETDKFPKIEALFADLAGAANHDQAIRALSNHKFSLHESSGWLAPLNIFGDLKTAFTAPYIDTWRNIDRLRKFVTAQCREYCEASSKFDSPYTSVSPSSACGNSRLLREYANEVPGGADSACFPRPSVNLKDYFVVSAIETGRVQAEAQMVLFLLRLLAAAFLKANDLRWESRQLINCQSVGLESARRIIR